MKNNYLNLLGLAYRAGKCSLGEDSIVKAVQQKKAKLVLLANDIGPRTRKKLINKCKTYDVPFEIIDDRETLSNAIGKPQRVAVAVLDAGFAAKISSLLG
ncbi:L7Ae/L30e/S12e/Gadd45 family ribosomal protein [Lentibacillus sp.]|uniref:L7Ae/L30e/S12e/Gadd45 family ribosomal protein n=1 Tax=Lentibacillus sp. TaxID=1925746 RepID=UPI002B4ACA48|nr:ribosomal L7Ae/L30e/S12e/Gadd45 family protein [Lentibacillus sp.]HLS07824.1 ribosomal L7Ae/L30e/S12e/Gadd45 family protein [Lentibacillus sp.]